MRKWGGVFACLKDEFVLEVNVNDLCLSLRTRPLFSLI